MAPGSGSWRDRNLASGFPAMLRSLQRQARSGSALPFAITFDGQMVGQLTVGNVLRGPVNSAFLGYWIDEAHAGRGLTPTAVALAVDHSFGPVGLRRVEAHVQPDNVASRRVLDKLGFREEAHHVRYLYAAGAYRDHLGYALTAEEVPLGLTRQWRQRRSVR